MGSFSLIDVMLNRPPEGQFSDMGFSIVRSWFVLLLPWAAMIMAFWFSEPQNRWGLRNCYPILINLLLVGVHAFWCWKVLTTRLYGSKEVEELFQPFVYALWPLYILGIGLLAWHLIHCMRKKIKLKNAAVMSVCYIVLAYPLGVRAWDGYAIYRHMKIQMSEEPAENASNKSLEEIGTAFGGPSA